MKDLIILLIGFGAGYWFGKRKVGGEKPVNPSEPQAFIGLRTGELRRESGLSQAEVEKDENMGKVAEMFNFGREITNDDIEKALGVSDATATRYLDKLEEDGKIVQIGKEGRFVKYHLK